MFLKNNFRITAIKTYTPFTPLVQQKIFEQYPKLDMEDMATHFVEIQDKLVSEQGTYHFTDKTVEQLNMKFKDINYKKLHEKIGVLYLGNAAPGCNNIIDGLL